MGWDCVIWVVEEEWGREGEGVGGNMRCWMLDVGYFGRERRIDGNGNRESKRVCGTKRKRERKT